MALSTTVEKQRPPLKGEHLVLSEHMLSQGEDAVPQLCDYLKDPRLHVRIIAARTLETIGDERAVEPLCRVLESDTRRTPLWVAKVIQMLSFAVMGILVSALLLSAALGFFWLAIVLKGALSLLALAFLLVMRLAWWGYDRGLSRLRECGRDLMTSIGGQDELVRSAADALAAIAAKSQDAAVRRSLPMLRRVSTDRLVHSRDTREAAARASARIQMSTAALRRLPITVSEHRVPAADLPIAGAAMGPPKGGATS